MNIYIYKLNNKLSPIRY